MDPKTVKANAFPLTPLKIMHNNQFLLMALHKTQCELINITLNMQS